MLKHNVVNSYGNEYFELYRSMYEEFKDGATIREWTNRMRQILNAVQFRGNEEEILDQQNKFKGDQLEVLAEIFFNAFKNDEGVGIKDYTPVQIGDDFGVDATGINVNGHKVAVQVKYRSNPVDDLISYADLARTYTSANLSLGNEDITRYDNTLYLFTTAAGVTGAATKVFGKKLVIINRNIISTKIDNNKNFWEQAYNLIYQKLD